MEQGRNPDKRITEESKTMKLLKRKGIKFENKRKRTKRKIEKKVSKDDMGKVNQALTNLPKFDLKDVEL